MPFSFVKYNSSQQSFDNFLNAVKDDLTQEIPWCEGAADDEASKVDETIEESRHSKCTIGKHKNW